MPRPPQRAWIKTTRSKAMRVTNTVARVLAAGAGLLLATAGLAQSPGYPDRPVKIIVPFAAAGPTDVVARLITQKLSEKYGQQFYIENVAGAGGNLGMATAGRSPSGRLHHPVRVIEL